MEKIRCRIGKVRIEILWEIFMGNFLKETFDGTLKSIQYHLNQSANVKCVTTSLHP